MENRDDRLMLVYRLEGNNVLLMGRVLTNHSMSIDDALNFCDIDMDSVADQLGWDGWDYECIDLLYGSDREEVNVVAYLDESLND